MSHLDRFGHEPQRYGDNRSTCRICNTVYCNKYRQTDKGKKAIGIAVKKSISKHRSKQNARAMVNYHLRKGYIVAPKVCSECQNETKVEAHHEDYTKPLEVTWMCRRCHCLIHRNMA